MSFGGLGATQKICQPPMRDLELPDDGTSSVISEHEKQRVPCSGQRRTLGVKQRQSASTSTHTGNNWSQRTHGSPLPAYPVSIRQQLAIIKQMEQPMQMATDSSSASLLISQASSVSPGSSKKRISKVHKKNERGETPLHVAARKGEHQLCRKLIEEGALINARDYAGWTPLHEACYRGHFKVAKLLLDYNADVNALSDCDDTPLHDAVTSGNEKLVWLLLHAGAIRDRVDSDGKKPIDICLSEYGGIRNLLSANTVPSLYPTDESPSLSPCSPSHTQDPPHMINVNAVLRTPEEKQCLTSPNSNDSETAKESFERDRNAGASDELQMQLQETCIQPMKGRENDNGDARASDFNDMGIKDEEVKAIIRHGFDDIDSSFSLHRSLSPEGRNELTVAGLHTGPYEFGHDLTSHVSFEACFGMNKLKQGEIRHLGGAHGSHIERFAQQYISLKSTCNEKHKQRGRRRGRAISATGSCVGQVLQSDDVYEFRSSPESDVIVNKTESVGDMEQERSRSPSLKKRFCQITTTIPNSFTSTAISQTSTTEECISVLEKDETSNVISNIFDLTDEKADAVIGRKVPPLRISLPRTPTEDAIAIANAVDDVTLATTNAVRRNTRSNKSVTRRHLSPEQSVNSTCDESIQRVTRSKLRQAGRQLHDHTAISCEASAKKKSNSWRRNSTTIALPVPTQSLSIIDEQSTFSNDAGNRTNGDENLHSETAAVKEDENTLLALSLMKKNSYEGFQDFRSIIEGRWAKDATEDIIIPEKPSNFNDYLIVQGNYTSASNLGTLSVQEKVDLVFMEKLSVKLRALHTEQQGKRRNMHFYHQVERERLRMQAESEVIRMLTRKANERNGTFSTMRVIRETNLFNTGFLEVESRKLPVMEISEVKLKYEKLAEIMHKRQQMEADALYAEQVFVWNAAVQRSEDAALSSLKDAVPHVSVSSMILNF